MTADAVASGHEAVSAELATQPVEEAKRRTAALVVCAHSKDAAGARELLEMLGLIPEAGDAGECLADEGTAEDRRGIAAIVDATAREFEVGPEAVLGRDQRAKVIVARQVAMYVTRELTDYTLAEIGRAFGGRDHSTALNAVRRIKAAVETDEVVRQAVGNVRRSVGQPERPAAEAPLKAVPVAEERQGAGAPVDSEVPHGHGIGLALHLERDEDPCDACGGLLKMLEEVGALRGVAR